MRPASLVAAIVLDLVAVAHLIRLVLRTEVIIGGTVVPMWVSGVGFVVATALGLLVLREARVKTA